jgi:hypothetical protein
MAHWQIEDFVKTRQAAVAIKVEIDERCILMFSVETQPVLLCKKVDRGRKWQKGEVGGR